MQGKQDFDPNAEHLISLEQLIPSDHLLRKVDKALSLDFVDALTADCFCHNNGRPSIDPKVYFRMQIIGYLYGIAEDRRLCSEITMNLAYRWFCHLNLTDEVPDHSSLSRLRDRFGVKRFEQFFQEIVKQCEKAGLVKGKRVITDASLFTANASLDSLRANNPEQAEQEHIGSATPGLGRPENRKLSNQTHTSTTDPDATLAYKKGTTRSLKYKVHTTIDADSRVILEPKVTTGAVHDSKEYLPQLNRISKALGIVIGEAIADRGYGSGDHIKLLEEQGIQTYIPLFSGRSGKFNDVIADEFIYEKEQDRYRCPAGKYLNPFPTKDKNLVRYATKAKDCENCPLQKSCKIKPRPDSKARVIIRNINQEIYERVKIKMVTPNFFERMRERMWKIEGIFAEAKQWHCLRRAKYRGLNKVQIQIYMCATVLNIKRLVKAFIQLFSLRFNKPSCNRMITIFAI